MLLAIDTEYDEITKVPFICTMSDGETSKLFYPDRDKDWWMMKQICENTEHEKIFHSATSDIYALHTIGISVKPPYHDTFIMSSIIDENFATRKLKDLAKKYLKEPCLEAKELNKVKNKYKRLLKSEFRWSKIPKEVIEPYAIKDPEYTYALYKYFEPKIQKFMRLYNIELELIPDIVDMQIRGHYVDRAFCESEMQKLNTVYEFYYNKLVKFYGKMFNPGSSKEVALLLKKAGLFITEKTPKGLTSTKKEVLDKYADQSETVQWLLNCRNAEKQVNTYYGPLLTEYTYKSDPIAHFSFYQSGAKSGRFSAELIQTIPQKRTKGDVPNSVRRAFIPRPGYVNFYFDYDQIEMKLFAHFTNNINLIEAIRNKVDPYIATAIDLFGQEELIDDYPKELRDISKTINLGMIYGMGANKLAQTLKLPSHQAHSILSRYDQKYRIKSYMSKMESLLYRQGYIELEWIGREYRVPKNLSYKCVNIIIQGTAAYIIKLAMKRISDYIKKQWQELGVCMLLQIHDELVFEIPMNVAIPIPVIVSKLKELMEDLTTFQVPITASVKYSEKSWLDKRSWKEAA